MKKITIPIEASPQTPIVATEFAPKSESNKLLLINGALGIKQSFYYNFAQHFADLGYWVYTYDYRAIGESAHGKSPKSFNLRLRDWGQVDFPAVVDFLKAKHPNKTFYGIGNSLGGNNLGFSTAANEFKAFISVGSQHGYWGLFWASKKPLLFLLWYLIMPSLTRLYGYFPSRLLGMGEALPRGVALEWAKVCRSANWFFAYLKDEENYFEQVRCPILAISIEDDYYAPKRAVDKLYLEIYKNAQVERRHLLLKEHTRGEAVGHFGFFRKKFLPVFAPICEEWFVRF